MAFPLGRIDGSRSQGIKVTFGVIFVAIIESMGELCGLSLSIFLRSQLLESFHTSTVQETQR